MVEVSAREKIFINVPFALICAACCLIIIIKSIQSVEVGFVAVKYQGWTREVENTTYSSGLHWIGFRSHFVKYPAEKFILAKDSGYPIRTSDGVQFVVGVTISYSLEQPRLADLYLKSKQDYRVQVPRLVRAGILFAAGEFVSTDFFYNRTMVGNEISRQIAARFYDWFLVVNHIELGAIEVSDDSLEVAIEEVEIARQQARINSFKQESAVIRRDTDLMVSRVRGDTTVILADSDAESYKISKKAEGQIEDIRVENKVFNSNYSRTALELEFDELQALRFLDVIEAHDSEFLYSGTDSPASLG